LARGASAAAMAKLEESIHRVSRRADDPGPDSQVGLLVRARQRTTKSALALLEGLQACACLGVRLTGEASAAKDRAEGSAKLDRGAAIRFSSTTSVAAPRTARIRNSGARSFVRSKPELGGDLRRRANAKPLSREGSIITCSTLRLQPWLRAPARTLAAAPLYACSSPAFIASRSACAEPINLNACTSASPEF